MLFGIKRGAKLGLTWVRVPDFRWRSIKRVLSIGLCI